MANVFLILTILFCITIINAQEQSSHKKPILGQAFDEIVVSSDLNVRRKSKETRQGKKLLSNIPSATTNSPGKSTVLAQKFVTSDGSKVTLEKRQRREIMTIRKRIYGLNTVNYAPKMKRR